MQKCNCEGPCNEQNREWYRRGFLDALNRTGSRRVNLDDKTGQELTCYGRGALHGFDHDRPSEVPVVHIAARFHGVRRLAVANLSVQEGSARYEDRHPFH